MSVKIRVGESKFRTSKSTLERSPVIKMLLERTDAPLFMDRPGPPFAHILHWLRTGHFSRVLNTDEYHEIMEEADYYGLTDLATWISNRSNLYKEIYVKTPDMETIINVDYLRDNRNRFGGLLMSFICGHSNAKYTHDGKLFIGKNLHPKLVEILGNLEGEHEIRFKDSGRKEFDVVVSDINTIFGYQQYGLSWDSSSTTIRYGSRGFYTC